MQNAKNALENLRIPLHIFERLFTSDRMPTRKIGTGLGLAIVRELVDLMHGTITIDTSLAGTTFTVRIASIASEGEVPAVGTNNAVGVVEAVGR